MYPPDPARIHLLPAKSSPYVVVIRRKPSKVFHIVRWNTRTDELEHGSWFHGKLYSKRCDVSFDGQWMVYLAMGSTGNQWNGLCRLPFLRTLAEAESFGTYTGGGYWADANQLVLNQWQPQKGSSPFRLANQCLCFQGSDLGVLYARWQRDGWLRRGDNYGTQRKVKNAVDYTVLCEGDDGWSHQPTPKHPALIAQFLGYCRGYNFRYRLDGYDDLLDDQVDCACWDSRGNLIYSRQGVLTKLSLENIKRHQPGSVHDLEPLVEREAE